MYTKMGKKVVILADHTSPDAGTTADGVVAVAPSTDDGWSSPPYEVSIITASIFVVSLKGGE